MCQGIPRTVLEVGERRLRVQVDETSRWMQASEHLTREVTPGAFVIVYAGVAIEQPPCDRYELVLRNIPTQAVGRKFAQEAEAAGFRVGIVSR